MQNDRSEILQIILIFLIFSHRKRPTSFNGRLPLTNTSTLPSFPRIGTNYRNNYHSYYNVDSLDKGNALTNFKQRQCRSKLFYSDEEDTDDEDDDINVDSDEEFEHKELEEQIGNRGKRHQQQNNHNRSYLGNNLGDNDQENTRLQLATTKSSRAFATTIDGKQLIMNGGGSSNVQKSNHLSHLPFQKIGSSRSISSNNHNHKLTPGFHYIEGEDHYKKCHNGVGGIVSQLSYPISDLREEGKPHHQFSIHGTPSFFAQEHPTPPSFRVRHTRNDSCYSNNGLLSLGEEESNVHLSITTKQTSPPPQQPLRAHTKQNAANSAGQFSSSNTGVAPSTTKLRRSTSLRQHPIATIAATSSQPTATISSYTTAQQHLNKTGNNVIHGTINNNNANTTNNRVANCTHSQCSDIDSSFAPVIVSKKLINKRDQHSSPSINNNCIVRNTKSGVNKNENCHNSINSFKSQEERPNSKIPSTCSPSEPSSLNVIYRDPETISHNFKHNNPSSHCVTPLSLQRSGKQRQIFRRSTSSPSPSRAGHETTSSSHQHSSRIQKTQHEHNKNFIPQHNSNDITANKHMRNGNYALNITGAVNNITNSRNNSGSNNEFRHGTTHTRSSSASSFQKVATLKGYQQDTITSIRRSRERRSQNSPSLSRISSFSRTPSLRRSEKTGNKKCTTNKRVLPNMGNAVGSQASLASSTCSGIENGQWTYPSSSSCNQVIKAPPESTMALIYENEKSNNMNHKQVHSNMHTNSSAATNGVYHPTHKRQLSNFTLSDLQTGQVNHQNLIIEPNCAYQRSNTLNHSANNKDNSYSTNKNSKVSNNENNFQRHGSYSSFHFGSSNNNLAKMSLETNGKGNSSQGVMSCLQGNSQQSGLGNFKPISKKNSVSSFQLNNSSLSSNNNQTNATTKGNKMNNNFLLRSLSLRKGNNMVNSSSFNTFNHHPDILNDNKIALKPFTGVGSTLFDIKRGEDKYTLDEEREDEDDNSGPASLATSLPCLNNAILTSNGNHGNERHRTNANYPLSSNLGHRKGSLANKKKNSCSTNSGSTSTGKSSPSSNSTTPSSSSLVLNSLPYQNLPGYHQMQIGDNNNNSQSKRKNGSKEKQKITLSASSSSGLGSSGSSGTSSPNQRTSGGTSGSSTLHTLGSSTNFSLPISQSQQNVPANLIVAPKKRIPITDDPEGHLAYLPGDILMERYEIGKSFKTSIAAFE